MATKTVEKNDHPTRQRYDELRGTLRKQLLRSIEPSEGLLSSLHVIDEFEDKVPEIRSLKTAEEKADRILDLPLHKHYEKAIGPFLSVLRENGHSHVADVFTTGSNNDLLTDNTYNLLWVKSEALCAYLDPDCGIISSLISKRVFRPSDAERIKAEATTNEKVYKIIEILSRKSNSSYERFLDSLQEHDQEHVVYILTDGSDDLSPPITKEDLELLNKQREAIIENLESMYTSFVDTLVSLGVFTDLDRQRVEAMGQIHFKRNQQILNILQRKSKRHLDLFLVALNKTNQEHLIRLFKGLTISGILHIKLDRDSLTELKSMEKLLREFLNRDLDDKESVLSQGLDKVGIHGAGVDDGSIPIWFKFSTDETLKVMQSKKIDELFTKIYHEQFSDRGLESIYIEIKDTEFSQCRQQALMTAEHREALEWAAKKLIQRITVDEDLLKALSLCKLRRDAVLSQSSNEDKTRVLLEIMMRRPDVEFNQLVDALRQTGQNCPADFITGNIKLQWEGRLEDKQRRPQSAVSASDRLTKLRPPYCRSATVGGYCGMDAKAVARSKRDFRNALSLDPVV